MFNEFFFFTYIIAGFVGFLAILLAVLLRKYWASGNKQLLAAIRNFMICTACIDAMYFYLNYIFLKTGCYTTTAVPRVLDSFTYIGQTYFWAAYIQEKCQLPPTKRKLMTCTSLGLCAICLVTNLASYGFFMDDYYFVPPGTLRILSIVIEILLMFSLLFITVWHLMKGLSELVQKKIRIFVTVISVFITINGLWNAVFSLILMTGILTPPRELAMDPTGFFLLIINLFTVLLIYQEDFFALFRIEESGETTQEAPILNQDLYLNREVSVQAGAAGLADNREITKTCLKVSSDQEAAQPEAGHKAAEPPEQEGGSGDGDGIKKETKRDTEPEEKTGAGKTIMSAENAENGENREKRPSFNPVKRRLDFIAQSHSLTQREREVLELAYRGMTNPEIADELIISKYTVKRHMHNIFEKLDISTRMELVHLINGLDRGENGPHGPL